MSLDMAIETSNQQPATSNRLPPAAWSYTVPV